MTPPSRSPGPSKRSADDVLAEVRELANRQVRMLATGRGWEAWLRIAARLPGWDFTNIMLIAAQRPSATMLGGYDEWKALGRHVRRGERGIQIIVQSGQPEGTAGTAQRAKGAGAGPQPRVGYVWDVSQTTGQAVPKDAPLPDQVVDLTGLWEALIWLARREGFAVERVDGRVDSETDWAAHRIRVNSGLDVVPVLRVLLHELGHVITEADAPHTARESTAGCRGVRRVEADSVAFVVAERLGLDTSMYRWPTAGSWAGTDPRARPEEAVCAAGSRITQAAAVIVSHLDAALFRKAADVPVVRADERQPGREASPVTQAAGEPEEREIRRVLAEAERFYRAQLPGSWVPDYLAGRGLASAAGERWRAGYAPDGWTTLTSHLRRRGRSDMVIEAAGLARRSARGSLIDCFRDRAMFAVRDAQGGIAGFIGRARPDADADVPKYVNSPQTVLYRKGDLLFGLHEGSALLERGAAPVIVEGPFDAIAVTEAGEGRYVGLAPCGTALTGQQVAALAEVADLERTGVLVALDGDRAGHRGAVRAHELLLAHTSRLNVAMMPTGRDPAEILQTDGAGALADALGRTVPLAQVVIDAHLDGWGSELHRPEGQLAAMRNAAQFISATFPTGIRDAIRRVIGARVPAVLDEGLGKAVSAALPQVARALPSAAICQIVRVADRTGSAHWEVMEAVVTAAFRSGTGTQRPGHRGSPRRGSECRP